MRWRSTIFVLASCLLLPAARARACSQCLCGTPFPSDALGGVVPMQVRYGFEERYLSKANALEEGPGSETAREHRVSGFVLWRATNRLALLGRLPYNLKRIEETPVGEEPRTQTAKGIGDAEVSGLIGLAHTNGRRAAMSSLVLGVTAPTGSSEAKDSAGERLDAHLQPGSGAWSGTLGLNLVVNLGGALVDASILGRANGTNSHDYCYGDVLLYNAGYTSPARNHVRLLAQVNGRTARRDRFEDDTLGEHTGGTVIYLAPGARWQSGAGFNLEGGLQIPVVESLCGDQNEHVTGRVALSLSR